MDRDIRLRKRESPWSFRFPVARTRPEGRSPTRLNREIRAQRNDRAFSKEMQVRHIQSRAPESDSELLTPSDS